MWQLKVTDPSGQIRTFPVSVTRSMTMGRSRNANIPLREGCLPELVASIHPVQQKGLPEFWVQAHTSQVKLSMNDFKLKEAQLPEEIPLSIGQSLVELSRIRRPHRKKCFPKGVQPWLSCSRSGLKILKLAEKAAHTSLSVFLHGETGTGKEIVAHLIHAWSNRKSGKFVAINCGALPVHLAESELFGHIKGAFTNAHQNRKGAVAMANYGTLFLDEVADLSPEVQVKLLRFLEEGEVRPVGSDRTYKHNVRVICASHQSLSQLVQSGDFREDLFYRLTSITLKLLPLRERPEDIELLAHQFAKNFGKSLTLGALSRLQSYPWHGNVRELRHTIERASAMLPPDRKILDQRAFNFLWKTKLGRKTPPIFTPRGLTLKEMQKRMLVQALQSTKGNRTQAAQELGIARSTLFLMLKRHGIESEQG